jgi:hypothetical protein
MGLDRTATFFAVALVVVLVVSNWEHLAVSAHGFKLGRTYAALVQRGESQAQFANDTDREAPAVRERLIELAEAGRLPPTFTPPLDVRPDPRPLPGFGASPFDRAPFSGRTPSPRRDCQERIDRHVAFAAYLVSKIRLQENQRDAWRTIEDAATPALQSIQAVCAQLPDQMSGPPSIPELLEVMDRELTAEVGLVHAIREPISALYNMLSSEQRDALRASPFFPGMLRIGPDDRRPVP